MKNYKDMINKIGKDKLILMAAAGVVLLLCSVPGEEKDREENSSERLSDSVQSENTAADYVENLEQRLEEIIGRIEGVNQVSVMITVKGGESKEILKDESVTSENTSESDREGGQRTIDSYSRDENTIYYKNSAGEEVPYVLSELSPQIEGVAVVADGGDSPVVKEKIISLIKALFGIEINKIMVTV